MSAMERPISAGSGSLNPVVSVLSWSAMRVLSVGTTTSYIRARPGADSTMLSSGSGGQPRGARGLVQADCGPESGTSGLRFRRAPWLALLLAGCSSLPASMNPVSWWHDLQGGKIAEERPPPPGADQPYPNLASVPPKPEAPDRAALANIATALIADRTNAQHAAAAAPIADPSLPSASPALFGRGTVPPPSPPPPPGAGQASATMAAADAPPAAASPSPPANRSRGGAGAGQGAARHGAERAARSARRGGSERAACSARAPAQNSPLAPSGAAAQNAPLAPPGATAQPPAVAAAPPPALPTAPPPPPRLSGAGSAAPPPPPHRPPSRRPLRRPPRPRPLPRQPRRHRPRPTQPTRSA